MSQSYNHESFTCCIKHLLTTSRIVPCLNNVYISGRIIKEVKK